MTGYAMTTYDIFYWTSTVRMITRHVHITGWQLMYSVRMVHTRTNSVTCNVLYSQRSMYSVYSTFILRWGFANTTNGPQDHTKSVEGTQNQCTKLSHFQKGMWIENNFNMNQSVIQVEDFVVQGWTLNNTRYSYICMVRGTWQQPGGLLRFSD